MMRQSNKILPTILEVNEENGQYYDVNEQNVINQTEFDPLIVSLIEERDHLHEIINQLKESNSSFLEEVERLNITINEFQTQLCLTSQGNEKLSALMLDSIKLRVENKILLLEREHLVAERRNMRVVLNHIESHLFSDKTSNQFNPSRELVCAMETLFDEHGNSSDQGLHAKLAEERAATLEGEIEVLNQEMFGLREEMFALGDKDCDGPSLRKLEEQLEQARKIEAHLQKRCLQLSNTILGMKQIQNQDRSSENASNSQDPPKHCSSSASSEDPAPRVFQEDANNVIKPKLLKYGKSFKGFRKTMRFKLSSFLRIKQENSLPSKYSSADFPHLEFGHALQRNLKLVKDSITKRTPLKSWNCDLVLAWLKNWVGIPASLLSGFSKTKIDGDYLCTLTDSNLATVLQISNMFHRLKIINAVAELRLYLDSPSNSGPPSDSVEGLLNHQWICDIWLKYVGLPQYLPIFRHNLIDGRILASIKKNTDLFAELPIHSQFHRRSLYYSIELLEKFGFSRMRLDEAVSSSFRDSPLECWTANSVVTWLISEGIGKHVAFLSQKGVNGALIYHDDDFICDNLRILLQIDLNSSSAERLRVAYKTIKSRS